MFANTQTYSADVVIVGAGPTGLFLANLLGQAGRSVILLEKRTAQTIPSMAIGVMPPSLQMFEAIGLAAPMIQTGCQVTRAVVHDQDAILGALDLSTLPPPYSFVLSIPQGELMRLLRERLADYPSVQILDGHEVSAVDQTADAITVHAIHTDTGGRAEIIAAFAAACDGNKSRMRALLGIARAGDLYPVSFIMGDFPETTTWTHEAHLFFTPEGSVESFPLPGPRRRWIVRASGTERDTNTMVQRIHAIAGVRLDPAQEVWHSSFTPERQLAATFFSGRAVLCGDAAHVMSPIGGQGMNTGLADVWMLANILKGLLQTQVPHEPLFARYAAKRRVAFTVAANRAARGMWLGTRTGRIASALRALVLRYVLLGSPLARFLPRHFAMLTIPGTRALLSKGGLP
ncbi:MAG: NAD(P)/FAD-dependent oxidoreductase [bacterium]